MEFFRFGLNNYGLAVLTFFMLLAPAACYIMALMEGRAGRAMLGAGLALHALSIAHRGALLGWLPLTEKHDNISFMAFAVAVLYCYISRNGRNERFKDLGRYALPLICAMLFVSLKFHTINFMSQSFLIYSFINPSKLGGRT